MFKRTRQIGVNVYRTKAQNTEQEKEVMIKLQGVYDKVLYLLLFSWYTAVSEGWLYRGWNKEENKLLVTFLFSNYNILEYTYNIIVRNKNT